jgi:hemolysin activation/secretion protein
MRSVRRLPLVRRLSRAAVLGLFLLSSTSFAQVAPRFSIQRFNVEGNTVLPSGEVQRIVAPFTGPDRDFGDIQQALESLQDAYIARGFNAIRVVIPEQDIKAGQVTLQVIEAKLRQVRVEGNQHFSEANIRASIPSLVTGATPNTRRIGQDTALANENPSKQANVVLESGEQPADINAVVRVTDEDPKRYSVFLDNSGNSQTGYYRAGFGVQNSNLWGRDHVLNVQYLTSPDHLNDVSIYGLGYRVPLYGVNGAIDLVAGYSDLNSGTLQNLFTVSGRGSVYAARYTQVLPKIGAYEQRISAGIDYKAFQQSVVLVGTTGSLVPDITIHPVSLTYSGRLSQVGRDLLLYGTYSENLPGGADGEQSAFDAQRFGAPAKYQVWRYGGSVSQLLPQDFMLRADFTGQYTKDLLIAAEQFGMGGWGSVRGYLPRETINDVGHRLSVEGYSPDFGASLGSNWRARALAFVDVARGHDLSPARGPDNGLGSVGLGARINYGKSFAFRADWAHVTDAAGTRPIGKERVDFSIAYSF